VVRNRAAICFPYRPLDGTVVSISKQFNYYLFNQFKSIPSKKINFFKNQFNQKTFKIWLKSIKVNSIILKSIILKTLIF